MIKVLYITNSIGMGGASVAILNILPVLMKHGVIPFVLFPEKGTFSQRLDELEIQNAAIDNPLEIYPSIHNFKDYLKFPYRFIRLIYKRKRAYKKLCDYIELFKPDIIHTNVGPIHIGYKASKKYNIPHIWHVREYQKEDFNMHPIPSLKRYVKRLHDPSNHCICITKEIFNHFKLDAEKDVVIYDGVIDKNYRPEINRNKQKYILFAGRLEDAKGIKTLISAYLKYRTNGGGLSLYIAGKGNPDYVRECRNMIPDIYINNILFLGQRDDVYDLMYNAHIFVVSSRKEGFGFITAEAMFNGTIVIGRNTGGTKEQFDNGVELFGQEIAYRYNTEDELVTLLLKLEREIDYNKIEMAQDVVCKLYDIETQTLKILDIYNNEKCY